MKCHELFDHFWLRKKKYNQREARKSAYRKLARDMGIEESEAHFGMFSEKQCEKAIDIVARWYLQMGIFHKKKFKYWGDGYWRSVDSLGRVSQFYTWQMICKISDKLNKGKREKQV